MHFLKCKQCRNLLVSVFQSPVQHSSDWDKVKQHKELVSSHVLTENMLTRNFQAPEQQETIKSPPDKLKLVPCSGPGPYSAVHYCQSHVYLHQL